MYSTFRSASCRTSDRTSVLSALKKQIWPQFFLKTLPFYHDCDHNWKQLRFQGDLYTISTLFLHSRRHRCVKVKFSLWMPWRHMGVEVRLHSFLTMVRNRVSRQLYAPITLLLETPPPQ
jgi:hypothetical protein